MKRGLSVYEVISNKLIKLFSEISDLLKNSIDSKEHVILDKSWKNKKNYEKCEISKNILNKIMLPVGQYTQKAYYEPVANLKYKVLIMKHRNIKLISTILISLFSEQVLTLDFTRYIEWPKKKFLFYLLVILFFLKLLV